MLFGVHIYGGFPLALFSLLLLMAVITDVTRYRIPNWIPLSLIVLFIGFAAISPEPVAWRSHLGAGVFAFILGALLYVFRPILGAGDVKLLTAVSLWLGAPALPAYLLLVSVCGGILAIGLWTVREVMARLGPRLAKGRGGFSVPRVLVREAKIPYGVAIAVGIIPLYMGFPGLLPS